MIPVYSIAKPFLTQAVLELGLDLEAEIGAFLPDLNRAYASRRIAKLLNHTSGLADYSELADYNDAVAANKRAWPVDELLARCEALSHDKVGFHYSNIGYLLLVRLLEQQSGLPHFEALTELVFAPLGIAGVAEWLEENTVAPNYDPAWVYSGTFLAKPEAIGPALATLAKHRAETIGLTAGLANVPYPNTGFEQPGYNYGFMVDGGQDGSSVRYVGHGGGGPGMQLMVIVEVSSWKSSLQYSAEGLDQAADIKKMRDAFEA